MNNPLVLFLLSVNCLVFFCHSHSFTSNISDYDGLAIFDANETLMSLEDGLDEWHEKFIKPHVDPTRRILTASSGFTDSDLKAGGWVVYAFST